MGIINLKSVQLELREYGLFYIGIAMHLFGGILGNIAILASSGYAFYYFSTKKEINIYKVFLLLYPSICMGENSYLENSVSINVGIYKFLKNVLFIGPIALSTKLALGLALPVRFLLYLKASNFSFPKAIWFLLVFTTLYNLLLSFFAGTSNGSGLTVGLRIVLILGVLILPQLVSSKEKFSRQFDKIFVVSALSLAFGVMNGHWLFITYGFLPYLWLRYKSLSFRLILVLTVANSFLFGIGTTITIALIFLCSLLFLILSKINFINIKNIYSIGAFLVVLPVVITVYVVSIPFESIYFDFSSISGYIKFKLIGDRKPIWDATYSLILSNNFFSAPAGNALIVYFDYITTWKEWEEGSHNIFLEIGRQVSCFAMLISVYFLPKTLYSGYKNLENKNDLFRILSFTSIYIMFGISGQSLVYDGVGFMFWLLVGQFGLLKFGLNENIAHFSS